MALAQRCKRLGRLVVGVGVTGRTAAALIAACDSFEMYDAIPGASEAAEAADAGDEDEEQEVQPQAATGHLTVAPRPTHPAYSSRSRRARSVPQLYPECLQNGITAGPSAHIDDSGVDTLV